MHVLVAPAPFKGSLSAAEAARAIGYGVMEGAEEGSCALLPVADGGEGTLDALLHALGGERREAEVRDPLGRPVRAEYAVLPDGTAVIESAQACGLGRLRPEERDVWRASTAGVGDLIRAALADRPGRLLVGLGDSATVDGGAGMLEALEVRCGARLDLSRVDPRLAATTIVALCDVRGPLLGPRGSRLYMRQKGADDALAAALEARLAKLVADCGAAGREAADRPGAGAAGGLGFALALLGAELVPGAERVLALADARSRLARADLVVGGEGRVDEQTLEGKAMLALARLARAEAKPLVLLCGAREGDLDALHEEGVTAVFPIVRGPTTEEDARARAFDLLRETAREVARLRWLPGSLAG